MRVRRHLLGSLAMAIVLLAGLTGSAAAGSKPGIYDQGSWDDPINEAACDAGYQIVGYDRGHWKIANATKATNYQFFIFSNDYNGHTKVTNPANGKWVTEDWHGSFSEVHPQMHKDDPNVFTHETVEVGLYTIHKSNGKLAYADPYTVVTRRVFDTLGDGVPGGNELSYTELVNTTDQDFDFCGFLDKTIG